MRPGVIRLPSKSPPRVSPKKSKHLSTMTQATPVVDKDDVPFLVFPDKLLYTLFDNDIFGNSTTQDDLYHHFGTPEYHLAIS